MSSPNCNALEHRLFFILALHTAVLSRRSEGFCGFWRISKFQVHVSTPGRFVVIIELNFLDQTLGTR